MLTKQRAERQPSGPVKRKRGVYGNKLGTTNDEKSFSRALPRLGFLPVKAVESGTPQTAWCLPWQRTRTARNAVKLLLQWTLVDQWTLPYLRCLEPPQ